MTADLEGRLTEIVRASPTLMRVLTIARQLDLPQWRVVSGAVYQTIWNALTGRPADYGIRDYDLIYFDGSDLSYEAEDVVIRRAAAVYPPDLSPRVEVRNQARVHLWFEAHFGEPYAALCSTDESIDRFVSPAFAVGVRLKRMTGSISRRRSGWATSSPCACGPISSVRMPRAGPRPPPPPGRAGPR